MTQKERLEIYKAINNVSKKVNEMSQKMDSVMQMLNNLATEKISINTGGIDDLANIVTLYDEAIDELANSVSGLEV